MAEIATVARPYAEAAFKSALEADALEPVGEGLALVAAVARDPQMRTLLSNPKVTGEQKKSLLADVAGQGLHGVVRNLVAVLVDNRRESLVESIAEQYEELKREHQGVLQALITSAQPLSEAQRSEIVAALERRYGKRVEAELAVDPELLGGARVQIGDQVVHASVRDALAQMASALAR